MRAGAGYVTALVPASLELVFETRLLEVMTRGLPDEDGALLAAAVEATLEAAQRAGALVAGPPRCCCSLRSRSRAATGSRSARSRRRPRRPRGSMARCSCSGSTERTGA